jgi:hypothetical protein
LCSTINLTGNFDPQDFFDCSDSRVGLVVCFLLAGGRGRFGNQQNTADNQHR